MPKPIIEFDDNLFRSECRKMLRQLKIEEEPFIRSEAGFFAQSLSKITPPYNKFPKISGAGYNTKKNQRKAGENAIKRDMANIFTVRSREYLNHLIKRAGTNKNIELHSRKSDGTPYQVRVLEINVSSVRRALEFHSRRRGYRGRTPLFDDEIEDRWTSNRQMWITAEIWNHIYKKLIDDVGLSKAAFASYAVALGRPMPGKWVSKHLRGSSLIAMSQNPTVAQFTARAPGLDPVARNAKRVHRVRIESMRSKLKRKIRDQVKQTRWVTNIL